MCLLLLLMCICIALYTHLLEQMECAATRAEMSVLCNVRQYVIHHPRPLVDAFMNRLRIRFILNASHVLQEFCVNNLVKTKQKALTLE